MERERVFGEDAYPHKFHVSTTLAKFCDEFAKLQDGQRSGDLVSVAGKIRTQRRTDSDVTCYLLQSLDGTLPAFVDKRSSIGAQITKGDIVGVSGNPCVRSGELGIFVEKMCLLAPCVRALPSEYGISEPDLSWTPGQGRNPTAYLLKDQRTRYLDRVLDLIVNPDVKSVFAARTDAIDYIRKFMIDSGITEVTTGVLEQGTVANAFKTHHNQMNIEMILRVSSDQLLQLIVANYFGVFEIGKQFRNEEMTPTHNPEFTTCAMYKAYADYNDIMEVTETLLSGLVKNITGGYKVHVHSNGYDNPTVEIDFTPPFKRIEVVKGLEEVLGLKFPADLASEQANEFLRETCTAKGVSLPKILSNANQCEFYDRVLTSLRSSASESFFGSNKCFSGFCHRLPVEPFSICKKTRFYTSSRGTLQTLCKQKPAGEWIHTCRDPNEATNELKTLLAYGLPPFSGWVLGIDRLVMLLTDSVDIKEVLLYPVLPEVQ